MDAFTERRLLAFADRFRADRAVLPTLRDFEDAGFDKTLIAKAVRKGVLAELYVTLTSGAVVKGYKKKSV